MVFEGEFSISEGSMVPLEASCKGCHGFRNILRANNTRCRERTLCSDAVGTGQGRISHLGQRTSGPLYARVLGAERVSELKLVEVESNQIGQRRGLDAIQIVDCRLITLQYHGVDKIRLKDTDV